MSEEIFEPPASSREERIAYNEAWSRTLNQQKANMAAGKRGMAGFRCECWQPSCNERVPLSGDHWKLVRAKPNRFAVAPHHVAEGSEAVIETFRQFWLIEKFGEAGAVAEELADPSTPSRPLPT